MHRSKCLLNGQYSVNQNIRFKTPAIGSVLHNFRKIYIVIKEITNCMRHLSEIMKNTKSSISKINSTYVDNADDFKIFVLMYNLLQYSDGFY